MKQRKPDRIWHSLPEFSVKNAAFLVCDIDPACQPTPEVMQVLQLLVEDYRREPHRLVLASASAAQTARRVRDIYGSPVDEKWKEYAQHFRDPDDAIVSRAEVARWCDIRGIQSAFFGTAEEQPLRTTERNNLISLVGCLIEAYDKTSTSKHAKATGLESLMKSRSRRPVGYRTIEKWIDEAAPLLKPPHPSESSKSSVETGEVSDD